jgi:hypothetical protein
MDLNPVFTSSSAFRPATTGGELALFASAGISLVHGWLIDPESPEYAAVSRVKDYDSAMNLIVEADVLTRGLLVGNGAEDDGDRAGSSQAGPSDSGVNLSEEERRKVEDGEFLYYLAWVPASLILAFQPSRLGHSWITRARNSRTLGCSHSPLSRRGLPAPLNPSPPHNLHLHCPTKVLRLNPTHPHTPNSSHSSATRICRCCIGMLARCIPS